MRMISDVSEQLSTLVDDRFGPFSNLNTFRHKHLDSSWWVSTCSLARAPTGSWFKLFPHSAAGTSLLRSEAVLRCLGEAAERFSGLQSAVYARLFKRPLDEFEYFDLIPRCAADSCLGQIPNSEINDLLHSSMFRASDGAEVAVPAAYVHLGYENTEEATITHPISTGLAFHTSAEQALLAGIYEVLERDALMISWRFPQSVRAIPSSIYLGDRRLEERAALLDASGLQINLSLINVDPAPPFIVLCLIRSQTPPFCVVGTSAAADIRRACSKAIDEAVSIRLFCSAQVATNRGTARMPTSLEEHALYYAFNESAAAFEPFVTAPPVAGDVLGQHLSKNGGDSEFLRATVAAVQRRGLTVLWCDVTAPEIRPFGCVTRVFIPEAIPLSQTYEARWLATPRLTTIAERWTALGVAGRDAPHPFS